MSPYELLSLSSQYPWYKKLTQFTFYDVGFVKPFKHAATGVYNDVYTLQGVGFQYGLNYKNVSFAASLAKGIGTYEAYQPGNGESTPQNWCANQTFSLMF